VSHPEIAGTPSAILRMREITKQFSGTRALDGVNFDVFAGEVHALIGENGAGKSTLMNVLAGRFADYRGQIEFAGENIRIVNPRQALNLGIAVIFQELNVLPNLTVAENIMLGHESAGRLPGTLDRAALKQEAQKTLHYLRFNLPVHERVENLGQAHQCLVEIARAFRTKARLLVFDEPTASLGSDDVEKLFAVIRDLKTRGLGIVYISHRLAELPRIADRVTVLRDGKVVGTRNMAACSLTELTRMMLGRDPADGDCEWEGRAEVRLVPENRKRDGNITGRPVLENINASILGRLSNRLGYLSPRRLREHGETMMQRMQVQPLLPMRDIETLSGGNQQKVIIGRTLAANPKVILFDEPTQGIDVGTKAQIYRLIAELAAEGRGIILVSSEFIELTNLADRILVIHHGRLVEELSGDQIDEESLFGACVREQKE